MVNTTIAEKVVENREKSRKPKLFLSNKFTDFQQESQVRGVKACKGKKALIMEVKHCIPFMFLSLNQRHSKMTARS